MSLEIETYPSEEFEANLASEIDQQSRLYPKLAKTFKEYLKEADEIRGKIYVGGDDRGLMGMEAYQKGVRKVGVEDLYKWMQIQRMTTLPWSIAVFGGDFNGRFVEELVIKPFAPVGQDLNSIWMVGEQQEVPGVPFPHPKMLGVSLERQLDRFIFYTQNHEFIFLPKGQDPIGPRLERMLLGGELTAGYIIVEDGADLNISGAIEQEARYIPPILALTGQDRLKFLYGGRK